MCRLSRTTLPVFLRLAHRSSALRHITTAPLAVCPVVARSLLVHSAPPSGIHHSILRLEPAAPGPDLTIGSSSWRWPIAPPKIALFQSMATVQSPARSTRTASAHSQNLAGESAFPPISGVLP